MLASFFDSVKIGDLHFGISVEAIKQEACDIWCPDTAELKEVSCFISIGTENPGKKSMESGVFKSLSKTLVIGAFQMFLYHFSMELRSLVSIYDSSIEIGTRIFVRKNIASQLTRST